MTAQPEYLTATATVPGLSIVTCCRNRSENLIRAIPSWLALPDLDEVVIVDWSSDHPVADDLRDAGIDDPRIRIARVEGEPRWILSYAFNLGFRLARFDRILKLDADIVLDANFADLNRLETGSFIAGNWRTAQAGQQFVNGFFYIHHGALMAVGGFNEYITTYGWDDDDLYNRLVNSGLVRRDVAAASVAHLDHDDAERMETASTHTVNGWSELRAMTMHKIRTNRMIAVMMPQWDGTRMLLPFAMRQTAGGPVLRRAGTTPHLTPPHVIDIAERTAAYELVSWRAGVRTLQLPPEDFDLLLTLCRLDEIRPVTVELLLAGAGIAAATAARHVIVNTAGFTAQDLDAALTLIDASRMPRQITLRGDTKRDGHPWMPSGHPVSGALAVTIDQIDAHPDAPVLMLGEDIAAPAIALARPRLFIDAQHGLGNRMRAIGSASAIADATGRELVIVWQPDHHCDCRFDDLFHTDATVINESCTENARRDGANVVSYMEVEPDAAKDAALSIDDARDVYVRSAYVLNHPASNWTSENRFLRRLTISDEVRGLINGLPQRIDIGLHIRSEGAPGDTLQSYDSAVNWTEEGHAAITHWRAQSQPERFAARLDALLRDRPDATIWLAADRAETYAMFRASHGDRILHLDRLVYDRSAAQLRYALADALMLARSRHLLGSNWSSFTELVLRLAPAMEKHERSGVDF